ncbi:MAG: Cytochrome c1 heme lyase [Tremellales sp. Tagirdzhanova-0007]|nr:MAG: Cytochrome c1 heme lyase [Tremellales sp. Tagirdzhanova-0007]
MVSFNLRTTSASSSSKELADVPDAIQCPVDSSTRSKWLSDSSTDHPFHPPSSPSTSSPGRLSRDRVMSSIPRASTSPTAPSQSITIGSSEGSGSGEKWVYPSEEQFFSAMHRKNHNPKSKDMRTVVPIHNAVNEKAWEEVLMWESRMGGEKCGGPRLISFAGRPKDRTPKAWINTALGWDLILHRHKCIELTALVLSYTPPFDRHDWLIDRCGKQVRYVIDFYTGKADSQRTGNMAFYLDVRPAVDDWEGVRTRLMGWWNQWSH